MAHVTMYGLDPGRTVGVAVYVDGAFDSLQMSPEDALPWMRGWLLGCASRVPIERVLGGMERFVRGSRAGVHRTTEPDAEEFIARFDDLATELGVRRGLFLQGAGEAKAVCGDPVLRLLGWHRPGRRHANDAARHLGLRMLAAKPLEYHANMVGARRVRNVLEEV